MLEEGNNKKYLYENENYFPMEHRFIVSFLQYGPHEHTPYLGEGKEEGGRSQISLFRRFDLSPYSAREAKWYIHSDNH